VLGTAWKLNQAPNNLTSSPNLSIGESFEIYPFTAYTRTKVAYANSLDPDETQSNSASHPDPSCLTLDQYVCQILSLSVKFENEADEILRVRRFASGSEGVNSFTAI
jgi:hypothetical protein